MTGDLVSRPPCRGVCAFLCVTHACVLVHLPLAGACLFHSAEHISISPCLINPTLNPIICLCNEIRTQAGRAAADFVGHPGRRRGRVCAFGLQTPLATKRVAFAVIAFSAPNACQISNGWRMTSNRLSLSPLSSSPRSLSSAVQTRSRISILLMMCDGQSITHTH